MRYVAKRSKAGFDKVHEEFNKIYTQTLDRRSQQANDNTTMKGDKGKTKRLRWSTNVKAGGGQKSTTGTLQPQSSFTSYIMDDIADVEEPIEESSRIDIPKHPKSASVLQRSSHPFGFDSPPARLSRSFEESCEVNDDDNIYQVPKSWSKGYNPKSSANDGGYLPMDGYKVKPGSDTSHFLETYTITGQVTRNSIAPGTGYASIAGIKHKQLGRTDPNDDDGTGDYMNAPRKPTRSVFEPFGVNIPNAGKHRSCLGTTQQSPLVHVQEKDQNLGKLKHVKDIKELHEEDSDSDNIYVVPGAARLIHPNLKNIDDPDYQNIEGMIGDKHNESNSDYVNAETLSDSVFPDEDNIYQVPGQKYAEFPQPIHQSRFTPKQSGEEGHKGLGKSTSDPEMSDNNYEVPPPPRRLHTIDVPDEDLYQVPPSAKKYVTQLGTSPATSSWGDIGDYDVPPVRPHIAKKPVKSMPAGAQSKTTGALLNHTGAQFSEHLPDDDDIYDKPPAPVHVTIMKKPKPGVQQKCGTDKKSPPIVQQKPFVKKPIISVKPEIKSTAKENVNSESKREEFYKLDVDEVVDCLNNCCLTRLADVCKEKQFNGEFFRTVTDEELKAAPFEMNWFYVSKLFKVMDGWRPKFK